MLNIAQLFSYMSALAIAAAIPGPGMTALVARSVGGGILPGFALLLGIVCGDILYLTLAVFGLAVMVNNFASFFLMVRIASSAYLLWLAWQFWKYEPEVLDANPSMNLKSLGASWVAGLGITIGNPKTIAFYLALVPIVISLEDVTVFTWGVVLVPVTAGVLGLVGSIFILGAARARNILGSVNAQRIVFRTAAMIMFLAAMSMVVNFL
ncbi:LysE family translocator [Larsenimonas rhizosphaerae]|uniref:LysE family translocator n=1 Tax=Larsenimonas rhizosphaerae TaxID=2944682 RepID=A0AA42CTB9_9GAMM|nr:LysE family translocator [Larsenimonas rhizosphaerae]MCM2130773.1 LysE family translocator [Larsenimonas rhizosphaerae]MCX2523477.1 LysE family translocator [Larsenimonas rhizosphaerae]